MHPKANILSVDSCMIQVIISTHLYNDQFRQVMK